MPEQKPMDNDEAEPTSLGNKIVWGGLLAGAGVAIAAVVGFVFFPESALGALDAIKGALTSAYNSVGQAGAYVTQHTIGAGESGGALATVQGWITSAYEGVGQAGEWIGKNIVGGNLKDPKLYSELMNIKAEAAEQGYVINGGFSKMAVEESGGYTGIVGLIHNNGLLSTLAAGIGIAAIADRFDKPDIVQHHYHNYHPVPVPTHKLYADEEAYRAANAALMSRAAAAGHPFVLTLPKQR